MLYFLIIILTKLGYSLENNIECVKQSKLPAKFECPKKKDYMYNPQTKLCHSMSHHHSRKLLI